VRDRVGGEVGQIAEAKGPERIARREIEDLLAHVPCVAMRPTGAYFFAIEVSAAMLP